MPTSTAPTASLPPWCCSRTVLVLGRQPELDAVAVPVLVVQGASDPFGVPTPPADGRLVTVAGDHSLKKEHPVIRAAVGEWLTDLLAV